MNPISEVMKGITDLPLALLAVAFGLLLRKKEKNGWATLFFLVAAAALMGAAVHIIRIRKPYLQLLWVILYALLFESIRRFSLLTVTHISDCPTEEQTAVWAAEAVLYLGSVLLLFLADGRDIYLFVVFMAVMFCRIVVCLIRYGFRPAKVTGLMSLLLVPIVLQALAALIPFAVVAEHMILAVAQVVTYAIGKNERSRELISV